MDTWLIILISVAAFLLISGFLFTFVITYIIFLNLLVRRSKDDWGRTLSLTNDKEQAEMFRLGEVWGNDNEEYHKQVKIESEGFKLVGEYFDFGFKKAVIIIPGRMESGVYSYYFAEPFKKGGYNVLAIDNRSHGLSEGKYNCLGLKEYRDIINWAKMLHDDEHIDEVVLHGICIGCATALNACTSEDCPDYIKGMSAEGMYINFIESYRNHLIEREKPLFPFLLEMRLYIHILAKKDPVKYGPLKVIEKMKKPILFLHSRMDEYSLPVYGQLLYDTCPSDKEIVWFDKGSHSHIRINNTEKYDQSIVDFLKRHY